MMTMMIYYLVIVISYHYHRHDDHSHLRLLRVNQLRIAEHIHGVNVIGYDLTVLWVKKL